MVRVFNMNNSLDDEATELAPAFRAATSRGLERSFASSPDREKALQDFQQAALRLATHESAFNNRARPQNPSPGMLHHLRAAPHFAALRSFHAAKETLRDFSPVMGEEIARRTERTLMEKSLVAPAAAKPRHSHGRVPSGQTLQ